VQTDKTKESLEEMRKEFKDVVGARPASQEELDKAKMQQGAGIARVARNAECGGPLHPHDPAGRAPDDYWDTYAAKVKALSVGRSEGRRTTLIDPDHLIWVIVGDRAKIEKSIRELNLGEVRIIQAQ
jgi:zinc protease